MRILIADDNQLVRRGIAGILAREAKWVVSAEASDASETISKARQFRPDLILLDVSMPGGNGLETAHLLRQEMPEIRILIISQNDPTLLLPIALKAGAHGCIDKARLTTDLVETIRKLETPGAPTSSGY